MLFPPFVLGLQSSANLSELLDFDARLSKLDNSAAGIVSVSQNTQQAVKTESSSTNGAAVKDETSLMTGTSKPEGSTSFICCEPSVSKVIIS